MANPEIQIVAVCDPSKHAIGYRDWGKDDLLNELRTVLDKPDGGRELKELSLEAAM